VWSIAPESAKRSSILRPFQWSYTAPDWALPTAMTSWVDPSWAPGQHSSPPSEVPRRYLGYDTDAGYVTIAKGGSSKSCEAGEAPCGSATTADHTDLFRSAGRTSRNERPKQQGAQAIAEDLLVDAGFRITHKNLALRGLGVRSTHCPRCR